MRAAFPAQTVQTFLLSALAESCRLAGWLQTLCSLGQAEQSHHTGKSDPCASKAVGVLCCFSCVKVKYYTRSSWQQASAIFMLNNKLPVWVTQTRQDFAQLQCIWLNSEALARLLNTAGTHPDRQACQ